MFAYCLNNPVNLRDPSGTVAVAAVVAPAAYEAFMAFLASVAASNAWNVVGWGAAAILATGVITIGAMYLYEWFLNEQAEQISVEVQQNTEGYAPPPGNGDDDDDEDDYYDDDSNFGGRQKIGKPRGNAPGNNRAQNKQFKDATKGLLNKDQQRALHNEISGKGLGFHDIVNAAKNLWFFIIDIFYEDDQ
jgi:hypothetical protein